MAATISMTEEDVFVAVRAWLLNILGSTVPVVQGLINRVPTPKDSFVALRKTTKNLLGGEVVSFTDQDSVGTYPAVRTINHLQSMDFGIQADIYGESAGDWAAIISTLWTTADACTFLSEYDIAPLTSDDPKRLGYVSGENQYIQRWVVTLHLQYNPSVALGQDFMSEVEVDLINVDATYPA